MKPNALQQPLTHSGVDSTPAAGVGNPPLDKNGRKIAAGDAVVPTQLLADYLRPRRALIEFKQGILWLNFGDYCHSLGCYRNGDTNFHAVEVVDPSLPLT